MKLRVAVAADHAGFALKTELVSRLRASYEISDLGASVLNPVDDYPDFVVKVTAALISGEAQKGIIICGSGVGACIAANKTPGVRACLCHDTYSAHQGVEHDDMNVLCLGARVIGIEDSAAALKGGSHNARGLENVRFLRGAAENVMRDLDERIDAAIIDPPRAGCKREVIDALKKLHPAKIIYVSCDPATLARDLNLFCADRRYAIAAVQPIDMFPQTYHIETVVTLSAL